jgi:hypothetical protein
MEVRFRHDDRREFNELLPPAEKDAMVHAIEMLEENGEQLGHPYTSDVRIAENPRDFEFAVRVAESRLGDVEKEIDP